MRATKPVSCDATDLQIFTEDEDLSTVPLSDSWAFTGLTIKDTSYATHGYYTYPAKFIPQLAARIIEENSDEGDTVVDPFLGSGTTVVESLVHRRRGVGTDVNDIAVLLAKVKSTPIDTGTLMRNFFGIMQELRHGKDDLFLAKQKRASKHVRIADERIDYWFKPHIKHKLLVMLKLIRQIKHKDSRDFFLIAFAQILKSCSIWMQKSVKPCRDAHKPEVDPIERFERHAKRMMKKHAEFNGLLDDSTTNNIDSWRVTENRDARCLPCEDESVALIATSPPYVTSYEYADLHQLASLWLGYLEELAEFRQKFIGSSARERDGINLQSKLAEKIIAQLGTGKTATEVENYFADMLECFTEMRRVLRIGGRAAIVIGNTTLRGVRILNAEVFKEQFENIGFRCHRVIHREIPSKMLPSTRDPQTGRFVKGDNAGRVLIYPTEHILIMEKE